MASRTFLCGKVGVSGTGNTGSPVVKGREGSDGSAPGGHSGVSGAIKPRQSGVSGSGIPECTTDDCRGSGVPGKGSDKIESGVSARMRPSGVSAADHTGEDTSSGVPGLLHLSGHETSLTSLLKKRKTSRG